LGFDSPNTAIITALEKLISEPELKRSRKEQEIKIQELGNRLEKEQKRTQEFQRELEIKVEETQKQLIYESELKRSRKEQEIKIQELGNRLEEEQKRTRELQRELEIKVEETQKQIKDLEKNIEKAERREIYLEEIHNNYMLQVQTLIKQKQILAPGEKKQWWRFW
jgi:hypothetical protein